MKRTMRPSECSVGGWVERLHLDTANTFALNGSDLDVSLVSPGGTPRVTDDVVFLSTLGSVSNGSDGVIEVGTAGGGVEDTASVLLEDGSVGLDGDGDDGLGDGSLELSNAVAWHVGDGRDLGGGTLELGGDASSGNTSTRGVWVGGLEGLSLLLKILEGLVLPSTIATVVGLGAGNKLLLREGKEGSGLDEVSSLGTGGGSEGPA